MDPQAQQAMENAMQQATSTAMYTVIGSVVFTVALMIFVYYFLIPRIMGKLGPDKDILQNGHPGKGKILAINETGVRLNDMPQVMLTMEITPEFGGPYTAQTKMIIQSVQIPQFQPGALFPVKISPKDNQKVVLDIYQQR